MNTCCLFVISVQILPIFITENYLDMNLAEKRAQYKCGEKYVQLEGVDTWTQYAGEVQLPPVKGNYTYEPST